MSEPPSRPVRGLDDAPPIGVGPPPSGAGDARPVDVGPPPSGALSAAGRRLAEAGARAGLLSWLARKPYALLVLTMALWSGNYVASRAITDTFAPAALAQSRWTLAFLILLPVAWPHLGRDAATLRAHPGILILLGVLGVSMYNTLVYLGIRETTVVNATLLASLFPVTVALVGFVLYRDRLTLPQVAGIAIATLGAAVVLTQCDIAAVGRLTFNPGDLWVIGSQLIWALYTVLLRERPQLHPLSFLTATVFVGQLALWPYTVLEYGRGMPLQLDAVTVGAIVYVTVFASLIAFVAFNRAVELIGSNRTGPFFHLIPVFGTLLAVVLLGESVAAYHLVGWALIVTGIVAAQLGGRAGTPG